VHDLEAELFNSEPKMLNGGVVRYEAKSGYHDDPVMALCLAYAGASIRCARTACQDLNVAQIEWRSTRILAPDLGINMMYY